LSAAAPRATRVGRSSNGTAAWGHRARERTTLTHTVLGLRARERRAPADDTCSYHYYWLCDYYCYVCMITVIVAVDLVRRKESRIGRALSASDRGPLRPAGGCRAEPPQASAEKRVRAADEAVTDDRRVANTRARSLLPLLSSLFLLLLLWLKLHCLMYCIYVTSCV